MKHQLHFVIDDSLNQIERKWVAALNKKYLGCVHSQWKDIQPIMGNSQKKNSCEEKEGKIFIVIDAYEK